MINGEHDKDYEEQLNVLTCRIPRNFFPAGGKASQDEESAFPPAGKKLN